MVSEYFLSRKDIAATCGSFCSKHLFTLLILCSTYYPTSAQNLFLFVLLIIDILDGVTRSLGVVWICIFWILEMLNVFMCSLLICVFSFEKYLFCSCAHSLIKLLVFYQNLICLVLYIMLFILFLNQSWVFHKVILHSIPLTVTSLLYWHIFPILIGFISTGSMTLTFKPCATRTSLA